jgi:hypothetical protein
MKTSTMSTRSEQLTVCASSLQMKTKAPTQAVARSITGPVTAHYRGNGRVIEAFSGF